MNLESIKKHAEAEIEEENFRAAVEIYKTKLRAKRWWHNIVPFKIVILRRQ